MMRNLLLLFTALIFLSCGNSSNPDVAGGVETGNGFVVGIAYASDNEPTVTTISLVPTNFNPVTDKVDSTLTFTTPASGEYEISAKPGTYNVVAFSSENETALIRSITVEKQQRRETDISLVQTRECVLALDGKNSSAGSFYFEGTLSSADYDANAESARFENLPNITTLPALYQYEDGTENNIVEEFEFNEADTYEISGGELIVGHSIVASSLRGTDGFENFTSLLYDKNRESFWAGTKFDGLFRFDNMGKAVKKQYNPLSHPHLERTITDIKMSLSGELFLATKIGVVAYNSQENMFDRLDSDNSDSLPVIDLEILSDGSWISAYRTGVQVGDTFLEVPELTAMVSSDDRIYAGTDNGNIFSYDMLTLEQTLLPATYPAVKELAIAKDGTLLAVTSSGISIIKNGGEVKRLDFFANRTILSIRENSVGEIYVLTDNSGLYMITKDHSIATISGFEDLLPNTTTGSKFNLSDIAFDTDDNIYLLVINGALIKIER